MVVQRYKYMDAKLGEDQLLSLITVYVDVLE